MRISQFTRPASTTSSARASDHSSLPSYPVDIFDGASHVEALSVALAAFGASARQAIDTATEIGDQTTADVFTEISRGIDKYLWFVQAHAAIGGQA